VCLFNSHVLISKQTDNEKEPCVDNENSLFFFFTQIFYLRIDESPKNCNGSTEGIEETMTEIRFIVFPTLNVSGEIWSRDMYET